MVEGHKEKGKFHPHTSSSGKLSSSQVDNSKHESSVDMTDAEKLKQEKEKHLLKPENLEKFFDNEIKRGSYEKPTPILFGLDGKPLPVSYSLDWHDDLITDNPKYKSQGFLSKIQEGIPKLNKKYWYKIRYNDHLVGIAEKKSDLFVPSERGHWEKAKEGVYWSGDGDDAIMLIRGDLLTQDELTQYYINTMRFNRKDDPFNEWNKVTRNHPFIDTVSVCQECGMAQKGYNGCTNCGLDSKQSIPYDLFK